MNTGLGNCRRNADEPTESEGKKLRLNFTRERVLMRDR